ncbi:S8/S53 family peptidase [Hwangdonia lutea]|uniref:S8/S53 family peptidase n=1 Tax=Hwangdonia lutea TaxID=3075823 RepID=A0AA97HQ72_9FLAO|nr:S8/S53 family peptidase [Hwangdonia sp. SCSIO 19198]WOD42600.1 S8/S53 family peptidase [Hwangdonia sp. SCSIO 19198]
MKTLLLVLLFPIVIFSQGNPAFTESKIDDVYSQFNLTGDGVIFAIIERGIDYTHPAFINPDGTTKIKYIYDMVDASGASHPDNTYGIGTIHTEADINASLLAGGTPLTTDRYGHGTACAGIVSGNGEGTASKAFHGVAVDTKLIVVKLIHDAFPAFGSEPGQSAFFNPSYIPVALQFVEDKVAELGLPSVTLMNFGSIGGPTDGTSAVSQAMDNFINKGNILVCGVGDDGGNDNHATGTIAQDETQEILINKAETGNLRFDLWYSEDDRFTVTIELPNTTQVGPFAAPSGANAQIDWYNASFNMYHRGANVEFAQASSHKRELMIDLFGATGTYKIILNGASITDSGTFHATLNPSTNYNNNKFLSHITNGGSINDYATATQVITPTNYVSNISYTDVNGIARNRTGQGNPGEIWTGSSEGPTHDGRQGVDFATPGEVVFAPYSPNTYYSNFPFNMVQGGNNLYGIQTAVSAAAPVACGIIALMLELDPTLSNNDIKDILASTATTDGNTGITPNTTWGGGKVNALAAMQEVNNRLSVNAYVADNFKVYPNPADDVINIASKTKIKNISIYTLEGRLIKTIATPKKQIEISNLKSGIYFLKLESDLKVHKIKFLKR